MSTNLAALAESSAHSSVSAVTISRNEVEDLLYTEAECLDTWRLQDWLSLFTEDAGYFVPSTDLPRDASEDNSLFYIADDAVRLRERVVRLMKKTAHSEYPRSRTRHLVSNVRVVESTPDAALVTAAFATWRMKNGNTDVYVGSSRYRLKRLGGQLRIAEKRVFLDLEALRPHGRVSILL
nr:F67 [uncultured bacterium]